MIALGNPVGLYTLRNDKYDFYETYRVRFRRVDYSVLQNLESTRQGVRPPGHGGLLVAG